MPGFAIINVMKKFAIGVDDFKKLRESDAFFVDKSLFIRDVLEDRSEVLLFSRPRRFGKTLNLSMLRYFLSNENAEENQKLFEGLAVTQSNVYRQQGKYPVIFLSLKDIKSKSFDDLNLKIRQLLSGCFSEHTYLLENERVNDFDRQVFNSICKGEAQDAFMEGALKLLSKLLYQYYQQKVFLLIDEYDTPIHEAYLNGFYEPVVNFLRILLGNALKSNEYLQKGVLTGILRVSKESMFSDLNNVKVYSVLSYDFNTSFGFTQHEVDQILADYQLNSFSSQVKQWYNGYYLGDVDIYNPWSIICFVDSKGIFKPYWLNTSANELVHNLIKDSDASVKKDIEDALNLKPVFSSINESISFQNLQHSRENIISFFVQTGYLKARSGEMQNNRLIYEISIPNDELKLIYSDTINLWFETNLGSIELNEMLKALISGNIPIFERIFSSFVLETLSYFNVGQKTREVERVFQAFLLGMLVNLKEHYEVYSEKESGYGRFDISVVPKDKSKQALILELKSIDTFNGETKDQALDAALKQIEDRRYETLLRQQGCTKIMKVAVTFDGKRVWAKTASQNTSSV